ncbi:hypothetical protein BS17DRAFT_793237 [Gyrodon lividus]|nr:hypothetical protein BS17DRAFT_793237 [Gyrodon lividus]
MKKKHAMKHMLEAQKVIQDVENDTRKYIAKETIDKLHAVFSTSEEVPILDGQYLSSIEQVVILPSTDPTNVLQSWLYPLYWLYKGTGPLWTCICGCSFSEVGSMRRHEKGCAKGKKRLSGALEKAKEVYHRKKLCYTVWAGACNGIQAEISDSLPLAQRRPQHLNCQPPLRFRDVLPEPPPLPGSDPIPEANSVPSTSTLPIRTGQGSVPPPSSQIFKTNRNTFGLFCVYRMDSLPSHKPEDSSSDTLPMPLHNRPPRTHNNRSNNSFYPYPNQNSLLLGDWYWNHGSQKSKRSFQQLIKIIGSPDFRPEDIRDTKWSAIDCQLGTSGNGGSDPTEEWLDEPLGWKQTDVTISAPFHRRCRHPGPKDYCISDFYHHSLLSIIREKVLDPTHHRIFHFEPYELRWHPPHRAASVGVHGELFTSRAFLQAHQQLQESPPETGCTLPRRIITLMFWSNSTQLTSFGSAKLWPLYVYFGNESKYMWSYFQSLPDKFKDFATEHAGKSSFMLNDEFVEAYKHGIVLSCCDGIKRRLYPRIFTYSADYPEKVLIANIRNLGGCPCPLQLFCTGCDMLLHELLAHGDTQEWCNKISLARKLIYEQNYAVDSTQVEALLKKESWVPTTNAFSARLSHTGFDVFLILVVDLLHEFELGVWKAVFTHLLRILDSLKAGELAKVDYHYRQVPTFGCDSIRRFRKNVLDMGRTTACDFEDLLQCAIPVFETLMPEPHNSRVLQLLFTLCHWHGVAKLRLHTDKTLDLMVTMTSKLLRNFVAETCAAFSTKELRREAESRKRHGARKNSGPTSRSGPDLSIDSLRPKVLNLQTYKLHALADYPAQIRMYGTTDSYSTQPGELEHRTSKGRFTRTSRKKYTAQLASIERRQECIRHICAGQDSLLLVGDVALEEMEQHHNIGASRNFPEKLVSFARRSSDNPATENFVLKLKAYLLPRVAGIHTAEKIRSNMMTGLDPRQYDDRDMNEQDPLSTLSQVIIKGNHIYCHYIYILCVNSTTYDLRRETDIIKPRSDHRDIMMLSPNGSESHRFCYARVIGIYYAEVIYASPGSKDYQARHLEFLWDASLDMLQFVPLTSVDAFGFVNPEDIVRGCHIIPAFAHGRLHPDGNPVSMNARDSDDWRFYYVNRFVDRDMLLRYHWGLVVGHAYTHCGNDNSLSIEIWPFWVEASLRAQDTEQGLRIDCGLEPRHGIRRDMLPR